MKKVLTHNVGRPDFVGEVVLKTRPKIEALAISGSGDPMLTFDDKLDDILRLLKNHTSLHFGIFYKNRDVVGIDNVEWDACVMTSEKINGMSSIRRIELPEIDIASITLTGPYSLIGDAIEFMKVVLSENNVEVDLPLYEMYLKEGKNPVTELQYPISPQK